MITPPSTPPRSSNSMRQSVVPPTPMPGQRDFFDNSTDRNLGGVFYDFVHRKRDASITESSSPPSKKHKISLNEPFVSGDVSQFFRSFAEPITSPRIQERSSTPDLVEASSGANASSRVFLQFVERMSGNRKIYQRAGSEIIKASISSPFGEGVHSRVSTVVTDPTNEASLFSEGFMPMNIPDARIVVKIPKENQHVGIKEGLRNSAQQYRNLEEDFSGLSSEKKPYAQVYNRTPPVQTGFVLQEKVLPFGGCPWSPGTQLKDLPPDQMQILEQVKQLFHYSYTKDTGGQRPGLDLWWPNLGKREGSDTVVIYDYREDDDAFYVHAKEHLHNLSNGSSSIRDYLLEGLGEKVKKREDSFLMERFDGLTKESD